MMKPNRIRKNTKKMTLAASFAALSFVLLLVGSFFESLDLTFSALASFTVVLAVIELGRPYPLLIYAVTSLLALLLLPSKFAAVCYALFFGFYPIFKEMFERFRPLVSWVLKFSLFNIGFFVILLASRFLLGLPDLSPFDIPLLLLGNAAFFLFDFALSRLITLYLFKLRRLLKLKDYFE